MTGTHDFRGYFDHWNPEFGGRRYEIGKHLRKNCPDAHGTERGGLWAVARWDDSDATPHDHRSYSFPDGPI